MHATNRLRRPTGIALSTTMLSLVMAVTATIPTLAASGSSQSGQVKSGHKAIRGASVRLYATGGSAGPRVLGQATTRRDGTFRIGSPRPTRKDETRYLIARGGHVGSGRDNRAIRLATVLGRGPVAPHAVINERTTVASAFALAQFFERGRFDGPSPGLPNAAANVRNLVSVPKGTLGHVLTTPPNGPRTPTMATFDSLANLLAGCVRSRARCQTLFDAADPPGVARPRNTLKAAHNIATHPSHRVRALFRQSLETTVYRPALRLGQRPVAWTLALRYDATGDQMNGPGLAAIDARGSMWITNNYVFSRKPLDPDGIVCGDTHLLRLKPNGQNHPGAPYTGGGLYGDGFGITIAGNGTIWTGNFGFAGTNCPMSEQEQADRSKSLSQFRPNGTAISPDASGSDPGGWMGSHEAIFRPQGMASDRRGNIWVASCGNGNLVMFKDGDPDKDRVMNAPALRRPFAVTIDPKGRAWVTGNKSASVLAFDRKGRVVRRLVGQKAKAAGVRLPMGIASDSRGNIWVSNSGVLKAPCDNLTPSSQLEAVEKARKPGFKGKHASMAMLRPDGTPHPRGPFKGAGLILPWGVAIDGNDNVWVANFDGRRLSYLCGARTSTCPPGKRRVGAPISPPKGYFFKGLVRNTGVTIAPSGDVVLMNNWRTVPNQTNPGGHQVVVFLGLAKPVKTPLVGAPRRP